MKCPLCNGKFKAFDSRNGPLNTTRRRKQCIKCNQRFTTYEYIGEYPSMTSKNTSYAGKNMKSLIGIMG